jgi:hypothetical protein
MINNFKINYLILLFFPFFNNNYFNNKFKQTIFEYKQLIS